MPIVLYIISSNYSGERVSELRFKPKGEIPKFESDQSQETPPVTVSVAPVEGKKWKRVSSHLEQKKKRRGGGRGRSRRGDFLRTKKGKSKN